MNIVCLSFDDGTVYDLRFIELLNKYGLSATLNLNSELDDFVWYYGDRPIERLKLAEVKSAYDGHEVASHSLTHPYFSSLTKEEAIRQVRDDINNLEAIFGRGEIGFAFPFHDHTEENIATVRDFAKPFYIRYSCLDYSGKHKDRYHIHINALYDDESIYERLVGFSRGEEDSLFVIAGHSYEFEMKDDWGKIERLLSYLKENENITVMTMRDAVRALFDR